MSRMRNFAAMLVVRGTVFGRKRGDPRHCKDAEELMLSKVARRAAASAAIWLCCYPIMDRLWAQSELSFRNARRDFPVGRSPRSVAVGDFNGDGILDLAVANTYSDSVSVLIGIGDGTFQPAQTVEVRRGPQSITVGDFNGDGVPDLAVSSGSLLLGNGDGTFRRGPDFEAIGVYLRAGDFNGDNIDDLAAVDAD